MQGSDPVSDLRYSNGHAVSKPEDCFSQHRRQLALFFFPPPGLSLALVTLLIPSSSAGFYRESISSLISIQPFFAGVLHFFAEPANILSEKHVGLL